MESNLGWIKLHRKILNWGWYSDRDVRDVFIHLLLSASHKESTYLGRRIKVGERVFGRIELAKEIGISEQTLRTCLTKLKSTSELTIKSYNKYSVVSINNYTEYQSINQRANQPLTNNQPATNHIQEDKKIRSKEDMYITPEIIKEISDKYSVEENSVKGLAEDLTLYCKSTGKSYKDYPAALMNWVRRAIRDGKVKVRVVRPAPENDPTITEEQRVANIAKMEEMRSKFYRKLHLSKQKSPLRG